MSRIHVLPTEVANRIAAGEVIERPASVVKELVENSIDAGAKRITVQSQNGGKTLIQVTDDGCGMDADDAILCLEPHSTSKIRTTEDIERITTMGFRGEAIPSIASVSRFHLQTRQAGAAAGTEVLIENGTMKEVRECGCPIGTNIRIGHLFGGLPARRKFMKSPATEDAHIQECVLMQALAHPDIGFELLMNDREVFFAAAGGDLRVRIGLLMGRDLVPNLLPVDHEEAGVRIRGYVSRPGETRPTRRDQRVFINGRPASADLIHYAIRDAYGTLVVKGRYPVTVLYLEMDPERVDVNVHPAKREVRFREDRVVGQAVLNAVREALRQVAGFATPQPGASSDDVIPGLMPPAWPPAPRPAVPAAAPLPPSPAPAVPILPTAKKEKATIAGTRPRLAETAAKPDLPIASAKPAKPPTAPVPPPAAPPPPGLIPPAAPQRSDLAELRRLRVLGQLNETFIIAEGPGGLVLIDPNAAHQRIIFEQLLDYAKQDPARRAQQPLLLPVTTEFAPEDAALLHQNLEKFQKFGFGIEHFGGRTFLITAMPAGVPENDVQTMFHEILDDLRHSAEGSRSRVDDMRIAKTAARHAVRARQQMTAKEIQALLEALARTQMPYACPEGRPTMINLPYSELDRRFGRNRAKGAKDL
jgi:DNA mismatch repair protein MutL